MTGPCHRSKLFVVSLASLAAIALPFFATAAWGPRYGGEITVGLRELPSSIDPRSARGTDERAVLGLVHETLVGCCPNGQPSGGLAASWSPAGDGEWTATLRSGMRFHDGLPIASDDAARSIRRFLRDPSPVAARLAETLDGGVAFRSRATEELPGILTPAGDRLVLRFGDGSRLRPWAPLSSMGAAVTSPAGAGCGPFIPTARIPRRRLALTAFGSHVRGRPFLDGVQVLALGDAGATPGPQAARLDVMPGSEGPSSLSATLLLLLNPSRSPFDQVDLRRSVARAIDRADLVRRFIPGGSPFTIAPSLLPRRPDPGRTALLPHRASVVLAVERDVPPLVSQRIVAHWAGMGLTASVVTAAPGTVLSVSADAHLLLWCPEVPDRGLALRELGALGPAVPAAQEALNASEREGDGARVDALLAQAEAALLTDAVRIPLARVPVSFSARPEVHGAKVDATGRLVLDEAWREP